MYAVLNLYNAKIEATDALLDKQKEYINNLKEQFSSEEKALGTKWEVEDRNESKSEISHKLSIYKNAVTQKGMDTYKSLQEQMKKTLGTKVTIVPKDNKKGRVEIEYYSQDELDRIVGLFQSIRHE